LALRQPKSEGVRDIKKNREKPWCVQATFK